MSNTSNFIDESRIVLHNLANPEGFYGEIVSSCLSTTFDGVNQWAVDLMQIQDGDSILEIGFGTGLAIQEMAARSKASQIIGIDTSPLMVKKATELNAQAIRSNRVRLLKADVAQLPEFNLKFDKILAVNSVMYWPEHKLDRIFKELRTRMAPGGEIYLVMHRLYERFERGDFNPHIQQLLKELRQAGFSDVKGTVQNVQDKQAAIAAGTFVCIALHGVNPAFVM